MIMNAYGPILVRASTSAGELAAKQALRKQVSSNRADSPVVLTRKSKPLPTFNLSELPPEVVKLMILPLVPSKFILLNKQYQRLVLDLMLTNPHRFNHNDLLYNYVKHNNMVVVENILNKSLSVNPSAKRNKIVREAICNGNIEILQLLIEHPKYSSTIPIWDVEDGNQVKNFNMIDYAAKQNQTEIAKLLIEEHSYLIELKDSFKKSLRYAVKNNNVELARYILSKPTQKPRIRCSKSEEILIPMPLITKKIDEDLYTTSANKMTSTYTYKRPVNPKIETLAEDEESIKLLRTAAKSGSPEMLKELIRHFKYSIETIYEVAELAAHEGHIGIIKTLVEKFEIEPAHGKNKILRISCLNGHAALAKFLFQYPNVTYFRGDIMNIFADCCRSEREDCQVISVLITQMNINLADEIEPRHFFSDLRKQGRLKVLTLLQTYFTQGKIGSRPLHLGGPRLQQDELKKLLLDTVNIRHDNLLLDFIESGDTDFVKLILRNSPIIKTSANNNNAIKQAILCNNPEMVKILIEHLKTDLKVPIKDESRMIDGIDMFPILGYAVIVNRPLVVQEILNSNKKHVIDVSEQNNFALRMAVKLNHVNIARFLLKFTHPTLYNDVIDNPLNTAIENNSEEMILLLARDKRFTEQLNPTSKIMAKALETAAQFGQVSAIKLLIDPLGVDPGSCRNDALKIACSDPTHIQVAKQLLSYPQVRDNKKKVFGAFLAACASGNHEIVKLFLNVIDTNEVVLKSRTLLKELKKRKLWHVIDVLMSDPKFSNNSPFVW